MPVLSPACASSMMAHHRHIPSQPSRGTDRLWYSVGSRTFLRSRRGDGASNTTNTKKRGGHCPSSYVSMSALQAGCRMDVQLTCLVSNFHCIWCTGGQHSRALRENCSPVMLFKATESASPSHTGREISRWKKKAPTFIASMFLLGATVGPAIDGIHGQVHLVPIYPLFNPYYGNLMHT